MSFASPLATITALVDARDVGDVDTALRCYASDAVIVGPEGTVSSGTESARTALLEFGSLAAQFDVHSRVIVEGPLNVALHYSRWTLSGAGTAGPFEIGGTSTDVLANRPGTGWVVVIDNPYGADILTPPKTATL
jgi:ketosteroid isomerase-like protein